MKRIILSLLLVSCPCWANSLHLEFAQEGEPTIPRALILIHNTFEDRSAFEDLFRAWSTRSWARDQYCSVYTYEYRGSGLNDLATPEALAQDLYSKIRSASFKRGRPDPINPNRRTTPTDERQPQPSLKHENLELLFAGHGYGGLIARETALLAQKNGLKVTRMAYVGTPLDGLSTIDFVLAFSVRERAQALGLSQPLQEAELGHLSAAWWHLVELFDRNLGWSSYFAPAHQDVLTFAAYGTSASLAHPTQNVLYGRHRKLLRSDQESDGFLPQPCAWGSTNGPTAWVSETVLTGTAHPQLSQNSGTFLMEQLVDEQVIFAYLTRRQQIEDTVRGDGELPPIGVYWDERDLAGMQPSWRNAYASQKGLYEMMWGVSP